MVAPTHVRMASALAGISVLIVEDNADAREILAMGLAAVGAIVEQADSGEAALALLETWKPDVILSDIQLPGVNGFEFLELLRANPRLRSIPAAALTAMRDFKTERSSAVFEKYMSKPTKLPEIVIALAALAGLNHPAAGVDRPTLQLHEALAKLNAASDCRYTSLLKFSADETLSSIWTYDRERPASDPFPIGLPVHASYCVLVRDSRELTVIEDAPHDARVTNHPKRDELARYIGAPLFRGDGSMFGTLCCYDAVPRVVDQTTRDAVAAAAKALEPWLDALFEP